MPENLNDLLSQKEEIKNNLYITDENLRGCKNLPPLVKHVAAFGKSDNGTISFSSTSIAQKLSKHGETKPKLVGFMVNGFNASRVSACPWSNTAFMKPNQTHFNDTLHLGTLRLYQVDGSFNEEVWQAFSEGRESISLSYLLNFLKLKTATLAEQANTGRHSSGFFQAAKEVSKTLQATAGIEAWKEVFKILACDWQEHPENSNELEPMINTELLKLFFEDSPTCLDIAEKADLPVAYLPIEEVEAKKAYS